MKFIYTTVLCFLCYISFGQNLDPVAWTLSVEPTEESSIYNVIATASIDEDWVIYSRETEADGPIPTSYSFADSEAFELVEDYIESKEPHTAYSELFELNVSKFDTEVSLIQKVKLLGSTADIHASVVFMTCSGDRCLPPKEVMLQTKI